MRRRCRPSRCSAPRASSSRWPTASAAAPSARWPALRRCAAFWTTTTPRPRPGRSSARRSGCCRPATPGCMRRASAATPASTRTAAMSAPSAPWSSRAARPICCMWATHGSIACTRRRWSNSATTTGCGCLTARPTWAGPWAPARRWRWTTAAGPPSLARSTCWPPTAPMSTWTPQRCTRRWPPARPTWTAPPPRWWRWRWRAAAGTT